jgi:hypothetical protein
MKRFFAFVECSDGFEVSFQVYPEPFTLEQAKVEAKADFLDHFSGHDEIEFTVEERES